MQCVHGCTGATPWSATASVLQLQELRGVEVFGIKKGLEVGMTHGDSPQLGMMLPPFPNGQKTRGAFLVSLPSVI
jgi:hypothetical protein